MSSNPTNSENSGQSKGTHFFALPPGTVLHEFEIKQVLGHGGFGITYLAFDTILQESVVIKEFLPADLAVRSADTSVMPRSDGDKPTFESGLESFLEEARLLARLYHPNIMQVRRFFKMHGTGYLVARYEKGQTLGERLAAGKLPNAKLMQLLDGLLDGLEAVHDRAILHRDLKPSNVMLREDGTPLLIDFGAARDFQGRSSRSVTAIATRGYSPPEQYGVGQQGPWTDIYALGGILYRCVTGEVVPDSLSRLRKDPLVPAVEAARNSEYDPRLLSAIDWMLRVQEDERPVSVALLRRSLSDTQSDAGNRLPTHFSLMLADGGTGELRFGGAVAADVIEAAIKVSPPGKYLVPSSSVEPVWSETPHYISLIRQPGGDSSPFKIGPDVGRHLGSDQILELLSRDGVLRASGRPATSRSAPPPRLFTEPMPASRPVPRRGSWKRMAAALLLLLLLGGGGYFAAGPLGASDVVCDSLNLLCDPQNVSVREVQACALEKPCGVSACAADYRSRFPGGRLERRLTEISQRAEASCDQRKSVAFLQAEECSAQKEAANQPCEVTACFKDFLSLPAGNYSVRARDRMEFAKVRCQVSTKQAADLAAAQAAAARARQEEEQRRAAAAQAEQRRREELRIAEEARSRALTRWSGWRVQPWLAHDGTVNGVAAVPDGSGVWSVGDDGLLRLWNADLSRRLREVNGEGRGLYSITYASNGQFFVIGNATGAAQMWEPSGRRIRSFAGHKDWVRGLALSPDNRYLLTASDDKTAMLWDLSSGQAIRTFSGHTDYVRSVAISRDSQLAFTGSDDKSLRVWEISSGRRTRSHNDHNDYVRSVAVSPDGRYLASGGDDRKARIREAASGRLVSTLDGHSSFIYGVAFSPDGRSLATASGDRTVKIWSSPDGALQRTLQGPERGLTSVSWSTDGRRIYAGEDGGGVYAWNTASGGLMAVVNGAIKMGEPKLSPNGRWLVAQFGNDLKVWRTTTGRVAHLLRGHDRSIISASFSPDETSVATTSSDGSAIVWNLESGQQLRRLTGHTDWARTAVWSPDGRRFFTGGDDKIVRVYDTGDWRLLTVLGGHSDWVRHVAVTADNSAVVTRDDKDIVRRWSMNSWAQMPIASTDTDFVKARYATDPRLSHVAGGVAVKGGDGTVRAKFFVFLNDEWMTLLPDEQTYTGSSRVEQYLRLARGDELQGIDPDYRQSFNKPEGLSIFR